MTNEAVVFSTLPGGPQDNRGREILSTVNEQSIIILMPKRSFWHRRKRWTAAPGTLIVTRLNGTRMAGTWVTHVEATYRAQGWEREIMAADACPVMHQLYQSAHWPDGMVWRVKP